MTNRTSSEIPLGELGISCFVCGNVVSGGEKVLGGMEPAMQYGLELVCHRDCVDGRPLGWTASAAAIRVCDQIRRGYYHPEANNHGMEAT